MQNARTAHALAHWRFHLNEWVVDFLKEEGYCTPEKIVQRDGWSIKRRRKYANKVVDSMEEAGEIKKLHRDFRNEINTAQLANVSSPRVFILLKFFSITRVEAKLTMKRELGGITPHLELGLE